MDISEIRKQNLLDLIERYKSQTALADLVDTSSVYLSQIVRGTLSKNGKPAAVGNNLARKIEEKLELGHGWMDTNHQNKSDSIQGQVQNGQIQYQGEMRMEKNGLMTRSIPVVSMVEAGHWTPVMASDLAQVSEYIPWIKEVGDNGFGVIVAGMSMAPYFLPGDRLYVNPDLEPMNGDPVIAMCEYDSEATFKQYIVEDGKKYIVPLNKEWIGYKSKELDEQCNIKGVVVSSIRPVDRRMFRMI